MASWGIFVLRYTLLDFLDVPSFLRGFCIIFIDISVNNNEMMRAVTCSMCDRTTLILWREVGEGAQASGPLSVSLL